MPIQENLGGVAGKGVLTGGRRFCGGTRADGEEVPVRGQRRGRGGRSDEDINPDKGTTTPTKPAQAPPGPLTQARAHELNFVMILKNEGPEAS
jgi:hypothetical protein